MLAYLPLDQCNILDTIFMCLECQGDLVFQLYKGDTVCDIADIHVKLYTSLLQDVCLICITFGGNGILV